MMPGRILRRASWRTLLRHPWQFAFAVVGVALGVGVVVAVDLANSSAMRAFELSSQALTGRATHQVVAGSLGVPEASYAALRLAGFGRAAPVIEGMVTVEGEPARALRLLGIDPFAEAPVRSQLGADMTDLLRRPGAIVMTTDTAADLGIGLGDTLPARARGRAVELHVAGVVEAAGAAAEGMRGVLVADIATVQEAMDRIGLLDRIDLVVDDEELERVRALLPAQASLQTAAARSQTNVQMTRAFRTNLTAMSLLALLCGAFLIYNTMTFSVVQRRALLGVLRAAGVTRREILLLVLGEAAVVGAVGTSLGLLGGIGLARLLVGLVARTINDLYFAVAVREVHVAPESLLIGMVLGIGATLIAAAAPAIEAAAASPRAAMLRSELEEGVRRLLPRLAIAGAAVAALGVLMLVVSGRALLPAFAGLFAFVLGAALAVPMLTHVAASVLSRPARALFGGLGALAVRGIGASLSRTAVAVAALTISVSVIVGVGVMVASFRTTLQNWLQYTLQADLYVSPAAGRGAGALRASDAQRRQLSGSAGVRGIQTIHGVLLPSAAGDFTLLVLGGDVDTVAAGYRFKRGDPDEAWQRLQAGDVWVSEPFAAARAVAPGDSLSLPTPAGPRDYGVAAVYYSYASDRGAVMMAEATYRAAWNDARISGMAVSLVPGVDAVAVTESIREVMGEPVTIVSNRQLREQSLMVFDRTFLITGVLRVLVVLVAFVGVLSSLSAQQLERAREFGMLRAMGMTPRQLRIVVTAQTAMMGLIAGLAALPLGAVLAWVMVYVINERSFGWSLQMHVPPEVVIQAPVIAVVAAMLGGLLPASRMAGALPADALRQE